ncbi:PAS domain S-box-containing protein [Thermonema lapsum]|uniref:PAS domain S-box-containing protein n=1 Tax=Thermonema lapsum TaxID=28195 RepID=A0A846MQX8_9BACT|nr:GAF domain-containing protein [Thermonema lapsum]NIK73976.1 PAS domain S-box-containing protein [Thermonema lapsum]
MKRKGLTIRGKILLGFILEVFIFAVYGVYGIVTVQNSATKIGEWNRVIDPSLDAIKDLKLLVVNSQRLTFSFIYSPPQAPTLEDDKQALQNLHEQEYPSLKERITTLTGFWKDSSQVEQMEEAFQKIEVLIADQKVALSTFRTVDDRNDFLKISNMNQLVEDKLLPATSLILNDLDRIEQAKKQEKDVYHDDVVDSFQNLKLQTILLVLFITFTGLVLAWLVTNDIVLPIEKINTVIARLSRGELPEENEIDTIRNRNDEVGEIARSVYGLVSGLRSVAAFAESIGRKEYNVPFKPLSENDVLGNALINMRDNLVKMTALETRQNWANRGLAEFSRILRESSDDVERMADVVISELVTYLKANQGGFFIVREDEEGEQEPYLELVACYAWDKKRFLEKKIYKGEGLTGQVWQEGEMLYLENVPDDYVMITSGLGKANPNSILIVPLKAADVVYGVIELASFDRFEDYQREFVEKVAESIAATLAMLKNNEKTQRLLEESKMLAERMAAQEEQTRQYIEEMQATQEELAQRQLLAESKELVIYSNAVVLHVNKRFQITQSNNLASQVLYYTPEELKKMTLSELFASEAKYEEMRMQLSRGQSWRGIVTIRTKSGDELWVKILAGTIQNGESTEYMLVLDDINEVRMLHVN